MCTIVFDATKRLSQLDTLDNIICFNLQQCVELQVVGLAEDAPWSVAYNRQLLQRPELQRPFDWLR